jgi:rhomboid family GlyGly-CTERM serine protease
MSDHPRIPQFRDISANRGLVLSLTAVTIALWLAGEPLTLLLRYERGAVLHGELWRVMTCHFTHADGLHLAVNLAGLWLVSMLVGAEFAALEWLIVAICSMLVIGIGFVVFEPGLEWYVGLSGVLHGLLAAGAVSWASRGERVPAAVLASVLIVKLVWEQVLGPLPFSGRLPVIVAAHLDGAIGGAVAALVVVRARRDV